MYSPYQELDTPALLIDRDRLLDNIVRMQQLANRAGVALRPHIKTHKMPAIAQMQIDAGATGIATAKVGEAEVMAAAGIHDIFIANEIIGSSKLKRLRHLAETIEISFGVDSVEALDQIEDIFTAAQPAKVLIEIEVGEQRSGVCTEQQFLALLDALKNKRHIVLKGLFSHDGHTYSARDADECKERFIKAQQDTLHFAQLARTNGFACEVVSFGSTPPFILGLLPLPGITELRIGTYVLMDASQSAVIGTYDTCAASVLTTVISKPTAERVITDAGAKALTMQERVVGICKTTGKGYVKGSDNIYLHSVYDEHGIFYSQALHDAVNIGDKIELIPNHICPVCNLYDHAILVSKGEIIDCLEITARGKLT